MASRSKAALVASLLFGQALAGPVSADPAKRDFGGFDTVGKIFLVATVEGAAEGMRASGWDGSQMDARISAQLRRQSDEMRRVMTPVRDKARDEALSGGWSEEALDGYLAALEAPIAAWRPLVLAAREAGHGAVNELSLSAAIEASSTGSAVTDYRNQAIARAILVESDGLAMADAYQATEALPGDYHSGDPFFPHGIAAPAGRPWPARGQSRLRGSRAGKLKIAL